MTHEPTPADDPDTTLPCGRDLVDLVAQVTDGVPPAEPEHQAACPHCTAALARIRAANRSLRALAAEPVEVPRGLTQRVLRRLRRERGRVPLASCALGVDTVTDLVIVQIARRAARTVDGVLRCSVQLEPQVGDGDLALVVYVTAAIDVALPALAEAVRQAVGADLRALTGLAAGHIEVRVEDVDTEA